jgi:predicted phage-related endonuclease
MHYLLQVTHQMVVTGLKKADIPVLIGGHDYRLYSVDYDAELAAMLIVRERTFWQHVIDGTPPDVKTVRDANARWQKDTGTTVEATQAVFDAVMKLRELDEQIARLEADHDAMQLAVKTCMAEASTLTDTAGMVLATWKAQSRSQFDYQAFKAAHPDLYKQFSTQHQTRMFRLAKGKL